MTPLLFGRSGAGSMELEKVIKQDLASASVFGHKLNIFQSSASAKCENAALVIHYFEVTL